MVLHPQKYDLTTKELFKDSETALVKLITRKESASIRYLDISFQAIESQQADMIFEADTEGRNIIFHIEFQTSNDSNMLYRMLGYANDILHSYKSPPYQVVIYMGKAQLSMTNSARYEQTANSRLDYGYELIDFSQIEAEEILHLNEVGLLPVLPLTKISTEENIHLRRMVDIILARTEHIDFNTRKNLIFKTEILAGIKFSKDVVYNIFSEVETMLNLKESSTYQRILEEGIKESVLTAVEEKFGTVPDSIRLIVDSMTDPNALRDLLRKTIKAKTLEDLKP